MQQRLADLERTFGGRIGVFAWNTADDSLLTFRAGERFPLCSTFKIIAVAKVQSMSLQIEELMQKRIRYKANELVEHSPVTEKNLDTGMTVAELCAAAIRYSDNAAANLLIDLAGGPDGVTSFARAIGDTQFRLDRRETDLNSAIPGDIRDTTTPEAMGRSLHRLVLGDALSPHHQGQLRDWLLGNTTGTARIRAAFPNDWAIGDKTGSGYFGTANDVAVLWPPQRKPAIVSIYTTQRTKEARIREDIVASTARIVRDWLA